MKSTLPIILTFSASDPTAGAGLQADCLTVSALGCHALNVLTAVTAQNTQGVEYVQALSKECVQQQLSTLIRDDIQIQVVKTGVLASVETVQILVDFLKSNPLPLVVDPVLASGRGDSFANQQLIQIMVEQLFPLATLVTPNWPEGKQLTGKRTVNMVAKELLQMGCQAVLLKGEHFKSEKVLNRLFYSDGHVDELMSPRLPGQYHGSGCTLASAVSVGLAQGLRLDEAVKLGLDFTFGALNNGFSIGRGQLIPDRMHVMQYLAEQV